jgi:hypothetical protein
VEKGFGKEKE